MADLQNVLDDSETSWEKDDTFRTGDSHVMQSNRTAAIAGILFALLYAAGIFMTAGQNIFLDDTDAEVLADWESANTGVTIAGSYIFAASVPALALFLSYLRTRCAT